MPAGNRQGSDCTNWEFTNALLRAWSRLALTQNGGAVESALHVGLD